MSSDVIVLAVFAADVVISATAEVVSKGTMMSLQTVLTSLTAPPC